MISPDTIISRFLIQDEDGHQLDELNQDDLLMMMSDDPNNIITYPLALLHASHHQSPQAAIRRVQVFKQSMSVLKSVQRGDKETRDLCDELFSIIRLINQSEAQECAEAVLKDFLPTPDTVTGYCYCLELLPQLVARAGPVCRGQVFSKLCEMSWAPCVIVTMASALVELTQTEQECRQAISKLSAYIQWSDIDPSSVVNGGSLDPEDLPALVYQLTALSRRGGGAESATGTGSGSAVVRGMVVDAVGRALDSLVEAIDNARQLVLSGEAGDQRRRGLSRVEPVLSTIIHHLSLLVSKDQGVSSEIVRCVRARSLVKYRSVANTSCSLLTASRPEERQLLDELYSASDTCSGRVLSPSRILLALLAARAPRSESAVLGGMTETIAEIHGALLRAGSSGINSLWFQGDVWRDAAQIHPQHLRDAFMRILRGPLMVEALVTPLVRLAFSLLSHKTPGQARRFPLQGASWGSLTASTPYFSDLPLPQLSRQLDYTGNTCASFGAWLVYSLFIYSRHTRSQIMKEVVLRLQLSGSLSVGDGGGEYHQHQSEGEVLVVLVLKGLIEKCLEGMMEVSSDLQEIFLSLPSLHPVTAGEIVRVLLPLFVCSPGLADRCALSLRKASFSKDVAGRQAAVCALTALLRAQLGATDGRLAFNPRSHSSQDDEITIRRAHRGAINHQEYLSQRVSGLSVDEVLSLCRRFMQHQAPVRALLYDRMARLQNDFNKFRVLLLRTVRHHLGNILTDGDSLSVSADAVTGDVDVLGEGPKGSLVLNLRRCVDSAGNITEAVSDLMLFASGMACMSIAMVSKETSNGDQYGFSQQSYSQESYSQSQSNNTTPHHHSPDAVDICRSLWRLARGLAYADLSDHGMPLQVSSSAEYKRLVVLVEATQTAMIYVMTLPEVFGGVTLSLSHRLKLLESLSDRLQLMSSAALAYRKSCRDLEREKAKESRRRGATQDTSSEPTTHISRLPLPRLPGEMQGVGREVVGVEGCSTLAMEQELDFLRKCLCELSPGEDDDEECEEEEENARRSLQHCPGVQFLTRHVRERSLRVVESVLQYIDDVAQRYASPSVTDEEGETKVLEDGFLDGISRLRTGIHSLYSALLRDMVRQRTDELDRVESYNTPAAPSLLFTSASVGAHLYDKQAVLRGMLGCVRAESLCGALLSTTSSSASLERADGMASMLREGFSRANLRRFREVQGSSLSASATGSMTPAVDLDSYAKKFVSLFLNMHGAGGRDGERNEAPLVVAIIGEIVDIMPANMKDSMGEYIYKQCQEKLVNPSNQLSQALVHLLVTRVARDPTSRLSALQNIAGMVEKCCAARGGWDEEDLGDGGGERGGHLGNETFTIVCFETVASTATAIVSLLDRLAGEADALLKVVLKSKGGTGMKEPLLSDEEFESSGGLRDGSAIKIDSAVCGAVQGCMEAVVKLLGYNDSAQVSISVISLFLKLYKIQVKLTRDIASGLSKRRVSASMALSRGFQEMCQLTAEEVTPSVQGYLTRVHNSLDSSEGVNGAGGGGAKKGVRNKLSKLIPELIFQMEQVDLYLIKLLSHLKDKDRIVVGKWIKRSTARDFRLKTDLIESEQDRARELAEDRAHRKRDRENKMSSQSGKKKKKQQPTSDEEDGGEEDQYEYYGDVAEVEAEENGERYYGADDGDENDSNMVY